MHDYPPSIFDVPQFWLTSAMLWRAFFLVVLGVVAFRKPTVWTAALFGALAAIEWFVATNHHMHSFQANHYTRHIKPWFFLIEVTLIGIAIYRCRACAQREQKSFLTGTLLATGVMVSVLLPTLFPRPSVSRGAARRTQCKNNLKQIGLALHNYHDVYRGFPMARSPKPERSWRVTLLPYFGYERLFEEYDQEKAWNAPENEPLQHERVRPLSCPSNPYFSDNRGRYFAAYAAVTGKGTIFPPLTSMKIRDMTDGTANTLAVVEACGQQIIWTEPRDIDPSADPVTINGQGTAPGKSQSIGSSFHQGGTQVLVADGSVRFVSENIDIDVLNSLLTPAGGEVLPEW